jgi:hypothetical protein
LSYIIGFLGVIIIIIVVAKTAKKINRSGKNNLNKKPDKNFMSNHGLDHNDFYVPDWIYDGHYDCGDK